MVYSIDDLKSIAVCASVYALGDVTSVAKRGDILGRSPCRYKWPHARRQVFVHAQGGTHDGVWAAAGGMNEMLPLFYNQKGSAHRRKAHHQCVRACARAPPTKLIQACVSTTWYVKCALVLYPCVVRQRLSADDIIVSLVCQLSAQDALSLCCGLCASEF